MRIDDQLKVAVSARRISTGGDAPPHALIQLRVIKSVESSESPSDPPPLLIRTSESQNPYDAREIHQETIVSLEQELQHTKENLQTTIEELETTNEELNATNEELVASNEELQSTNEELHSVNEELHTVNAEHQQKITELTQLTDDMNNLFDSTQIGTLFLGPDLSIRRYTPVLTQLFSIREADIGRPLHEIRSQFPSGERRRLCDEALQSPTHAAQAQVATANGQHHIIKASGYRQSDGTQSGLVLAFIDIDELQRTQRELHAANERFERFMTHSPIMKWAIDDQGRYALMNRAYAKMMGLSDEEQAAAIGKRPDEVLAEQTSDAFLKRIKETDTQALHADDPVRFEIQVPIHGVTHHLLVTKFVFYDAHGNRLLGGSGLPITDLKEAREELFRLNKNLEARVEQRTAELMESEKRFFKTADSAPIMLWIADQTGSTTWCNLGWSRFCGVPRERLLGVHWLESLHPDDRLLTAEMWERSVKQRERWDLEFRVQRHDGAYRWIYAHGMPRYDKDEDIYVGYIGTMTDITDLREAERELREAHAELEARVEQRTVELMQNNKQLAARNLELDQFAHAASHDLRTPLRTIIGFSEHLQTLVTQDQTGDQDQTHALQRIDSAARRMGSLLESLLLFATLGRKQLDVQPVDLNTICRQVLEDLASQIDESQAEIHVADALPTVPADASLIRQLIQNLVSNAIKYRGQKTPIIQIRSVSEDDQAVISISDNGVGIPEQGRDRLFEPFQRLHAGSTQKGSGLGLSICKRVTDRHGGRIWYHSSPGGGSTFLFALPTQTQPPT